MIDIFLTPEIMSLSSDIVLGCITSDVVVAPSDSSFVSLMENESIRQHYLPNALVDLPRISALRKFYKTIGNDPARYRGSAEALLRRLAQGKGLYYVNNVVDINNLLSLQSHFSVGAYSTEKLMSPVYFGIGKTGDSYPGIGKGIVNLGQLPTFFDAHGPFGSPTSDSVRSMITLQTKKLLMIVISFSGPDGVSDTMALGCELLGKFANARNIETKMVERGAL
ncbi:MAG: hypothetical protein ACD_62C00225G0006 [uncultured bacterium]|nr:MAG: hypothetical protein ACD_62C00225G0006 [uncultured bacterium]